MEDWEGGSGWTLCAVREELACGKWGPGSLGPGLSCAEDINRDDGHSEISPRVVLSDRGDPVVEAGAVGVRASQALDTGDLRRSMQTTKISSATEGIFLDSRLCDTCRLEFVGDSLRR